MAVSLDHLRVVHLLPKLEVGGIERFATDFAIALAPAVERVVVCSAGGPPFEPVLERAGIPVRRIPRPIPPRPWRLVRSALAVAGVLRTERPTLVHAHNPAAAIVAALARLLAWQRDVAIVSTYHGVGPDRVARAARALALTSDVVVAVTPAASRALRAAGVPAGRLVTVVNAAAAEPRRSASDVRDEFGAQDADLIVTVGRYEPEKNHLLLLDALRLLGSRERRVRAVLVGGGPLADVLQSALEAKELADDVVLAGEREDAIDIAAAADLFVLSSDWEALPLALLEAMALGRPIVATAVGGVTDAVRDEQTALLVPPANAEALATSMRRLLDDRVLAERLGAAARSDADARYSPARMYEGYARVYTDAVKRRRGRSGAADSVVRRAQGRRSELELGPAILYPAKAAVTAARSAVWLARRKPQPDGEGVRILFYHRISDERDELAVRPKRFREQMQLLAAEGYRGVDVTEIPSFLDGVSMAARVIGLSFDDGYEDIAEHALPVLEELGFRASVFVATGVTDGRFSFPWYARQPPLLGWDEIEELDRGGVFRFGAHTVSHPNLLALDDGDVGREIAGSKDELESRLGRGVEAFSYPAGLFAARERRLVAAAGFSVAVSCEPGVNRSDTDRLALRRRQVDARDTLLDFRAKVAGGHDTPLPLRGLYRGLRYGRGSERAANSRR